ncbi:hypothetical protein JMUB7504_27340 [Staphylococcus aureus]
MDEKDTSTLSLIVITNETSVEYVLSALRKLDYKSYVELI